MTRKYPVELVYSDDYPYSAHQHAWWLEVGGRAGVVWSTDEFLTPAEALRKLMDGPE